MPNRITPEEHLQSFQSKLTTRLSTETSASFTSTLTNTDILTSYDNSIKSFSPNILLNELASLNSLHVKSSHFKGVCMLADISGFTKLSSELVQDKVNGLDNLRRATSGFLSKFIYIVYSFGGDVISFAGDALICIFKNDDGQSECTSKQRAIECGLMLKEHCTEHLSAHIALSYGDLYFAFLGGYADNWVHVMNGNCMEDLSSCIEEAASKELVVSAALYECIPELYKQLLQSARLDSGNVRLDCVTQSTEKPLKETECTVDRFNIPFTPSTPFTRHMLSFLPPTVLASMHANSFRSVSELRRITTMFVKLDSYSLQYHSDPTALQPFFLMAQKAISSTGGVLRQFLVDDKGCVLIILWGVPSASFANNPMRALCCASLLFNQAADMDHAVSVGITTGMGYCGTIGSLLRRDYVAIGDTVNLSARLMGRARGRVLLDETTYCGLPNSLKALLTRGEEMTLKGKPEPVTPYTFLINESNINKTTPSVPHIPLSSIQTVTFHAQHISDTDNREDTQGSGQNKESFFCDKLQHTLHSLVSKLSAQHVNLIRCSNDIVPYDDSTKSACPVGAMVAASAFPMMRHVVVEGPHGSGKTEVVRYLKSVSLKHKVRCFAVTVSETDSFADFSVFRKLFGDIVGVDITNGIEQVQKVVLRLLKLAYPCLPDECIERKYDDIKHILGIEWSSGKSDHRSKRSSTSCIFKANQSDISVVVGVMYRLLCCIPTVIVIDDMHHCDSQSRKIISEMLTFSAPLLLMWTQRAPLPPRDVFGADPNVIHNLMKSPGWGLLKRLKSLFVSTATVAPSSRESDECSRQVGNGTYLRLSPLSLEQVEHLLQSLLCLETVPRRLLLLVSSVSSGNPYWINSIAAFVTSFGVSSFVESIGVIDSHRSEDQSGPETTESGAIEIDPAQPPALTGYDQYGISHRNRLAGSCLTAPSSSSTTVKLHSIYLRDYIVSLVDALPLIEQTVLKYASIQGVSFCSLLLSDTLPVQYTKTGVVGVALDKLENSGFIIKGSVEGDLYSFQNHRIREIIYDFTPPSDRSKLHVRIAGLMEKHCIDKDYKMYSGLAYHYTQGIPGDPSCRRPALKYTLLAARQHCDDTSQALPFLHLAENLAGDDNVGVVLEETLIVHKKHVRKEGHDHSELKNLQARLERRVGNSTVLTNSTQGSGAAMPLIGTVRVGC